MATRSNAPIVLGVDTATLEGRTLRWAAEQAHLEGRRLQLVTAAGPASPGQRDHGMGSLLVSSTRLNLRGEAVLDWAREELHLTAPYVEVDQMFQVADPSTLLLQLASSAHLVVLGSRGRGSLRSHVLGSVALAVVRHATCPVVVHRPVYPGQAHRGVVVAAEASEDSMPVLAFAFRQASLRRLPLRVAHFVYDARSELVGIPMAGRPRRDFRAARAPADRVAGRISRRLPGCPRQRPDATRVACAGTRVAQQASGSHRGGSPPARHRRTLARRVRVGFGPPARTWADCHRAGHLKQPSTIDDEGSSREWPPNTPASIDLVPRRDRVSSRRRAETRGTPDRGVPGRRATLRPRLPAGRRPGPGHPGEPAGKRAGAPLRTPGRVPGLRQDGPTSRHVRQGRECARRHDARRRHSEYGEGVLLVSWPKVPSATRHTFPLTRCELPVE